MATETKTIEFTTLEIGRTPGLKHLEHFPAGISLCGIDMFPAAGEARPMGFSRKGGRSGWNDPCAECVRRAKRYRGQHIEISGMFADKFLALILGEAEKERREQGSALQALDEPLLAALGTGLNPDEIRDRALYLDAREAGATD